MADLDSLLTPLGWSVRWASHAAAQSEPGWQPGRVAVEDKLHYQVIGGGGTFLARVTGRFEAGAQTRADYPKVGDWVLFSAASDGERARIHRVLPRLNRLARKQKGRETNEQVLVTNVNVAFIVQGLDRELNVRLIERFLVMSREGGVQPVVVLNKMDLDSTAAAKVRSLTATIRDVPVLPTCARTGRGLPELRRFIKPCESVVFMGASGVGKSTLINCLYGEEIQATAEVRESDAKGRHTTTWREMILLPSGGVVIDTPGMREFHMWLSGEGVHEAFPDIEELALRCHFRDCTHAHEKRCAVQEALKAGALAEDRYRSFLKLRRELNYLEEAHQGQAFRRRDADSRRRRVLTRLGPGGRKSRIESAGED
jgi:ribosome biogenesis GTPase